MKGRPNSCVSAWCPHLHEPWDLSDEEFPEQLRSYIWLRSFIRSAWRMIPFFGLGFFALNIVTNILKEVAWYKGSIRALCCGLGSTWTLPFLVIQALALAIHGYLLEVPEPESWNAVRTVVSRLQRLVLAPGCLSWTLLPLLGAGACWVLCERYLPRLCHAPSVPLDGSLSSSSSLPEEENNGTMAPLSEVEKHCNEIMWWWALGLGALASLFHGVHFHFGQRQLIRFSRFERRLLVLIRAKLARILQAAFKVSAAAAITLLLLEGMPSLYVVDPLGTLFTVIVVLVLAAGILVAEESLHHSVIHNWVRPMMLVLLTILFLLFLVLYLFDVTFSDAFNHAQHAMSWGSGAVLAVLMLLGYCQFDTLLSIFHMDGIDALLVLNMTAIPVGVAVHVCTNGLTLPYEFLVAPLLTYWKPKLGTQSLTSCS
eukprot:SAG11_NODE_57_length_19200_cov_18.288417_3_plen_427_part_00